MIDCLCQRPPASGGTLIENLERVRTDCPALREVYLPTDIWEDIKAWHQVPDAVAQHHSVFALALDRGHLARLTNPIHDFLLRDGHVAPNLRAQYREDLKERWMFAGDELRRHQRCRIYLGRITELQIAERLTVDGWRVTELEAFREGSDLTGAHQSEVETDFEIKMVGTEDDDFKAIVESMAGRSAARWLSPYSTLNYLLFRAYEAAVQLRRSGRGRRAVVVVSDWERFSVQLDGGWVDWSSPRFMEQDNDLLPGIRARHPELAAPSGLRDALMEIDALYVFRRANAYEYQMETIVRYRTC